MQTRDVRGQKMQKSANIICESSLIRNLSNYRSLCIYSREHVQKQTNAGTEKNILQFLSDAYMITANNLLVINTIYSLPSNHFKGPILTQYILLYWAMLRKHSI